MKKRYDIIIVGSGAAGGSLAHFLSLYRKDLKILLIEKGKMVAKEDLGKFYPICTKHYRRLAVFNRSKEGAVVYAVEALGGTTTVACGNLVRSSALEKHFIDHGVDLSLEMIEAERYAEVRSLPQKRITRGSAAIVAAARSLGLEMKPMPKGVSDKCDACGNCVLGCHKEAKFDVRQGIQKALAGNVDLLASANVETVVFSGNCACGVRLSDGTVISSGAVVICAGGLNTPVILQRSGVTAGRGLFIHPFEVTYGHDGRIPSQAKGMSMAAVHYAGKDIILSPFLDHWSQKIFACGLLWSALYPLDEVLGIMVKVADSDSDGKVNKDGSFNYKLTPSAKEKLKQGAGIAREILLQEGVKKSSIITTTRLVRGGHPSGTARLGEVVDSDLRVMGKDFLYVSDASVIPMATGTPPILTLLALNIRLAKHLSR